MNDRHVRILAVLMILFSLPLLLMLVLAPIAMVRVFLFDGAPKPDERMVAAIMLPLSFLLGLYGVVMAVVGRGLWRGRASMGVWAMVICASWITIGLLPFGAYGVFALVRPQVRDLWWPPKAAKG